MGEPGPYARTLRSQGQLRNHHVMNDRKIFVIDGRLLGGGGESLWTASVHIPELARTRNLKERRSPGISPRYSTSQN